MGIDLKLLEKRLAEHKVYDAWQYVQSLRETLNYMSISYEILLKVYEHRCNTIDRIQNDIINVALKEGQASFGESDLKQTDLNIVGLEIDDSIFLRKTAIEFFHYARISMDILIQIVNAALLGDKSYPISDKCLLNNVLKELKKKAVFADLLKILNTNKDNPNYKYLLAFDNYIKHIKTILITIKNSFLLGKSKEFTINEFCYRGVLYQKENVIDKVQEIRDYVIKSIEDILLEVFNQIPNCLDNSQRIQSIKFKQVYKKTEKGSELEYITFFIEVENDLSELPKEIKVLPLIIKPNNEIYSFDFKFDKIFIKKKGEDESSIIGCAILKNGLETNEFYRVFEVKPCGMKDYFEYIATFKNKYSKITMNIYAMEGNVIFIS
ncbi:hypothetical protein EPD62_001340 [Acetivibrio thermocellus]|uniref:hypothetical protein n=1 Tax=Acetivibrio thermocellus TaxID=1515 RepID=UPI0010A5C553|nr:hypothetical protein [Acetivibrio thermocellus]THJ76537.1 hypothetical protein EPD62_16100 [Acetivibrio thermocellus]